MEWISVKDRLPDYDVYCLWVDGHGNMVVEYLDKDGNDWLYANEFLGTPEVTHWMPLPEPPAQ